jgi:hypothetical protein
LLNEQSWEGGDDSWVRSGKNWQLVVGPSDKVLPEDVPEDVLPLLSGIQFRTDINLEPISAPRSAYTLLKRVARCLAGEAHGIILDPQDGQIITPSGIKRYQATPRNERFSILEMSWWFTDGPLLSVEGLVSFVELLEKLLPEALARRYGLYEPPQYTYEETGKVHFLQFLQENLTQGVVWYPRRPVLGVYLTIDNSFGPSIRGFRASHVTLTFESQVLDQPGWSAGLIEFWKRASHLISPFYGDVRILDGYIKSGASYAVDGKTQGHPVYGPWWGGIPRSLGQAAVLGEPYLSLWSEFATAGNLSEGLAFLTTSEWRKKEEVSLLIGSVPTDIAQPSRSELTPQESIKKRGPVTAYPSRWPFPGPFSENW